MKMMMKYSGYIKIPQRFENNDSDNIITDNWPVMIAGIDLKIQKSIVMTFVSVFPDDKCAQVLRTYHIFYYNF